MPSEGKTDMERIGLFSEMEYVTLGDKYVSNYMRPFNEAASKNKQMLPGGTKMLSALQAGYFEPQFVRVFEGEAYSNPVQLRRRYRLAESKKNMGKPFLPNNGVKLPCGIGTYYGTIGGPYPYFSAQLRGKAAYAPPGKNLYTNPGKKGTGYGYPNLTIGKQYPHSSEVYDIGKINAKNVHEDHQRLMKGGPFKLNLYPREYFDINPYHDDKPLAPAKKPASEKPIAHPFKPSSPAKKSGGMKAGTFDPYPSHSAEPYVVKFSKPVATNKAGLIFRDSPGSKSRPTTSIVALNVTRSLNVMNYKTAHSMSY
ncbi:cilia-and flagella-associated protein 96 [Carettochelys insculpta]|uniref:cilia-and flagella-associated protein 96 n=1 Tax=Carettochelys insculpta TaxID=44489 RepID=UPI003EBABDA5